MPSWVRWKSATASRIDGNAVLMRMCENAGSIIRRWRRQGIPVCYTVDAGANVHVLTLGEEARAVQERLRRERLETRLLLEVARAPWLTEEPMIAEMRLQFWRDTVEEIAQGSRPRAHEVAEPLAEAMALDREAMAEALDQAIAARRWDIGKEPFEDAAAFGRVAVLLGAEDGKVSLQLLGACGGCPLSTMTLTAGIDDEGDRSVLEAEFNTEPWFGLQAR